MPRFALAVIAVVLVVSFSDRAARAAPDSVAPLQSQLYSGQTKAAAEALQDHLKQFPDDDQARFGLGAVQFIRAVEHLEQALHRHGLRQSDIGGGLALPFFRLPVVANPDPQRLTYEAMRQILQLFVDDLALADQTLADVHNPNVELPLNIGLIRLDMNGDGKITDEETLWRIFQRIAPVRRITEEDARQFLIKFDYGDVPWLRAYSHLLMGLGEFLLAYDWHEGFEHTFHALFPNAGLPYSILNEKPDALRRALADCVAAATTASECLSKRDWLAEEAGLVDLVAFVHLTHWPVAEPDRMPRVLDHLEHMVAFSRESWRRILTETDDDHEWIPSPTQTSVIPGMTVTQERVDGWLAFLDEFDALLQGQKLVPHWRFNKGINLRRVFLEPTVFDPILWAQGSSAVPYLEDGEMTKGDTWDRIFRLFQGNFFTYAVWFN